MKKKIIALIVFATVLVFAFALTACFGLGNSSKEDDDETGVKVELKSDMVEIWGTHYYTGSPVRPELDQIRIKVGDQTIYSPDFTFSYENNVEPGEAKITLTATSDNRYVTGSAVAYYTIHPNRDAKRAATTEELKTLLAKGYYGNIYLDANLTLEEDDEIVIFPEVSVHVYTRTTDYGGNVGTQLTNRGKITIKEEGHLSIGGSSSYTCSVINSGEIVVEDGGYFNMNANSRFYNGGAFESNAPVECYGKLFTNSPIAFASTSKGEYVERTKVTDDNLTLGRDSVVFDDNTANNIVPVKVGDKYITYEALRYVNNENVGTAKVIVTIPETDETFYGGGEKEYAVVKGKTDFETMEEWIEKKATGKYGEYHFVGYPTLSITEDMTIDEDEILTSNQTILINQGVTLNVKGAITLEARNYANLSVSGTLNNTGTITLIKSMLDGIGTVCNGSETETGAFIGGLSMTEGSTFINYGTCVPDESSESFYMSFRGDFQNKESGILRMEKSLWVRGDMTNEGAIEVNSLTIEGTTNNSGTLRVTAKTTFQGDVINSGTMNLSGYSSAEGETFTNTGSIVVTGKLRFVEDIAFSNVEDGITTETDSEIWAYSELENVENTNLMTELTDEIIELSFTETEYTGTAQVPTFTINGDAISADELRDHFLIGYFYANDQLNSKLAREVVDAGTITMKISLRTTDDKRYYRYTGKAEKVFTIKPTSIVVEDKYKFTSYMSNANYNHVTLNTDVSINTSTTVRITAGKTLDLNGYSLEMNGSAFLENNGTLIIRKIGDELIEDNIGIKMIPNQYSSPRITNNGTIQNDGIIYIKENNTLFQNINGTLINNGAVYTYYTVLGVIEGTGDIYIRRAIETSDITLQYVETGYSGEAKEPSVIIKKGDLTLNNNDFTITYTDNTNAGEASVKVKTKDDIFNTDFCGETTVHFTINRAELIVTRAVLTELTPSKPQYIYKTLFENYSPSNYYKYTVATDFYLDNTLTLPDDIIFDIGSYKATFYSSKINFKSTTDENAKGNAELYVTVGTIADFKKYQYAATKITLSADIGEALTYDSNTKQYNANGRISYEYAKNKSYGGDYFMNVTPTNLTVDLNGHNFPGQFYIKHTGNQEYNLSFTNSSNTQAEIGWYSNQYYAIFQDGDNGDSSARLNLNLGGNIKIYGMKLEGLANGIMTTTVTDCSFAFRNDNETYNNGYYYNRLPALDLATASWPKQDKDSFIVNMTNCTVKGGMGANLGCAKYTVVGCTFEGTATYYSEDSSTARSRRGNAITLRQTHSTSDGSPILEFTARNCTFKSTDGYGLEFVLGTNTTLNMTNCTTITLSSITYNVKDNAHRQK